LAGVSEEFNSGKDRHRQKTRDFDKERLEDCESSEKNGNEEFAVVELAKAEYKQRLKSQLESIKKTDKKLLREMLYQMVLGRRLKRNALRFTEWERSADSATSTLARKLSLSGQ
jgi:hypothetical protein